MSGWKDVAGSPGYEINETGQVRTKPKELKPWAIPSGHLTIALGGKRRDYVHRLVAFAFIGPPPSSKHVINHKDGNPKNNHVGNLEWVTPAYNVLHGYRSNGRIGVHAKAVLRHNADGTTTRFVSAKAGGAAHGVTNNSVLGAIKRGGTCAGHRWSFA